MPGRDCSDKLPMEGGKSIRGYKEPAVGLPRECCDLTLYLVRLPYEGSDRLDFELGSSIGEYSKIVRIMWRGLRVHHKSDAGERRRNLFEHAQPFAHHQRLVKNEPGDVAARMRKAIDISGGNRVRDARENDGNRARFTQQCSELSGKARKDRIGRGTHELGRVGVSALVVATDPALVESDVAALRPATLLEALTQRRNDLEPEWIVGLEGHQYSKASSQFRLLRARRERPRSRRAAEQRDGTRAAVAVGTRVSSRAPRTEPYGRLSRIRLPPRVYDGNCLPYTLQRL